MTNYSEAVIYPVDYKTTSHIVDDDMHMIMVRRYNDEFSSAQ